MVNNWPLKDANTSINVSIEKDANNNYSIVDMMKIKAISSIGPAFKEGNEIYFPILILQNKIFNFLPYNISYNIINYILYSVNSDNIYDIIGKNQQLFFIGYCLLNNEANNNKCK